MINQWQGEDQALKMAGGKLSVDVLRKQYQKVTNEKTMSGRREMDEFMMLHNYIDKYAEKLGLSSTKIKKSEVEKVLAFVNKTTGRTAQDVVIDFASYKHAKTNLQVKSSVRSTLRENCEKRGMPKRLIDKIAPSETEISMRAIRSQLHKNKGIRQQMI